MWRSNARLHVAIIHNYKWQGGISTTLLIKNWTFQGSPEFCLRESLRSVVARSIRRKVCASCHGGVWRSGYPDKSAGQPPKQRPRHTSSTGRGPESRQKNCRGAKSRPAGCIYMWGEVGRGNELGDVRNQGSAEEEI